MALPHYNFYDMTLVEPRFIAANKSKGSIKFKYPRDESRGHLNRTAAFSQKISCAIAIYRDGKRIRFKKLRTAP